MIVVVRWEILKFDFDPEDYQRYLRRPQDFSPRELIRTDPNMVVDGGLDLAAKLLIGDASAVHLDNANAYIGVGDGTQAESSSDTGLKGTSKLFKGMKVGFPTFTSVGKLTFEADFGATEANFDWEEVGLATGNNPPTTGTLFSRKVQSFGNHAGGTWTVRAILTLSRA